MTNPKVMLYPLPHKIRGFICADNEGGELFVLNSRLTREANQQTMLHEMEHAANGDVYRDCDVNSLEKERHKNRNTGILKEKNALTTAKTMAERKLDNLYKLFENGNGDEYDMQRLENIKKELNNIKSKLKNLDEVNNLPELSEQNIESTLKYFKNKILEKDDMDAKKILIDSFVEQVTINIEEVFVTFGTKNVYMEMVPKTRTLPSIHKKYCYHIRRAELAI